MRKFPALWYVVDSPNTVTAMIGVAAPILLTTLRFAQGLAIGGQWGGAMLLVTESAPANQRGYYGAFAQAGAPIGVILANLALIITSASVSEEFFKSQVRIFFVQL